MPTSIRPLSGHRVSRRTVVAAALAGAVAAGTVATQLPAQPSAAAETCRPFGAIGAYVATLGGERSFLGPCTSNEIPVAGGVVEHFAGGDVYWSPASGTHSLRGDIRATYDGMGAARSRAALPVTDEMATPARSGAYNHFQSASLYWSPGTGSRLVTGAIRDEWAGEGWENSGLGFPVTNETPTPARPGAYNHFEGGSVYWSPGTGAHKVLGAIRDKWAAAGWENGPLGFPTGNETPTPAKPGTFSDFERGSVYWSPTTGAHPIVGAIRARWVSLGAENGALGFPVSDEYAVSGGARSDFAGGSITWTAATGALTVTLESAPSAAKKLPPPPPPPAPPAGVTLPANAVTLAPGASIQAAVLANPAGTTFYLANGTYWEQQVTPKDGDTFLGQSRGGVVVSGGRLLTGWRPDGTDWYVDGQTQHGRLQSGGSSAPGAAYPEDLFVNDRPLRHVLTRAELAADTWYFDYAAHRIYLKSQPGTPVVTSVTPEVFGGYARNVTIQSLTEERAASPAQSGGINGRGGSGWLVSDVTARQNHGVGINLGPSSAARNFSALDNGQLGLAAGPPNDSSPAPGIVFDTGEVARNNWAAFDSGWEAGGSKFALTQGLVVRNVHSHDNAGPGLWTDVNNSGTLYENNLVEDNTDAGIFHEISYNAVIRGNTVRRNGFGTRFWLYGAGILVSASANVEVSGNLVEDNYNGIGAVMQSRGTGPLGVHEVSNLYVHDNRVRMPTGASGLAQDVGDLSYFTSHNNRFLNNQYTLPLTSNAFSWRNDWYPFPTWQSYGLDTGGGATGL